MKKQIKTYASVAGAFILTSSSASAALFLANGDIFDGGTLVGTWANSTAGTSGFGVETTNISTNTGIEFEYDRGTNGNNAADVLISDFTITAVAGYSLDSITVSQNISGASGNNGNVNGTATFSVLGYGGSFTSSTGSSTQTGATGQISQPTLSATGDLEWNQVSTQSIDNANADWFVTLNDAVSGQAVNYRSDSPTNLFTEWVSFDATFSPIAVPEPSSAVLFGLGGLAFFARRRR